MYTLRFPQHKMLDFFMALTTSWDNVPKMRRRGNALAKKLTICQESRGGYSVSLPTKAALKEARDLAAANMPANLTSELHLKRILRALERMIKPNGQKSVTLRDK